MHKGCYSEELASRGRITFRRQHVEFEYSFHADVRSHSSFTKGPQCPSQVCAVRGEDLPLSCASWKLEPEPLPRQLMECVESNEELRRRQASRHIES